MTLIDLHEWLIQANLDVTIMPDKLLMIENRRMVHSGSALQAERSTKVPSKAIRLIRPFDDHKESLGGTIAFWR